CALPISLPCRFILFATLLALLYNFDGLLILYLETSEIQVKALANKLILPEVTIPVFLNFNGIILSHAFARLLFGYAVMAVVCLDCFVSLILDELFLEIDTIY